VARQSRKDSVQGQVLAQMEMDKIPIPYGFRKLGIRQQRCWDQYIRGRSTWREADLRILYFIVKTDSLIQGAYLRSDQDLADRLHNRLGKLWRDIGFQISTAEGNKLNRKAKVATAEPHEKKRPKLISI